MTKYSYLFGFTGRVNRYQLLIGQIVMLALIVGASFVGPLFDEPLRQIIMAPCFIIMLLINVFLFVKRYHDIDRPGWYIFLACIPIANLYFGIYLIYCLPGTPGPNKYGPAPN